MAKITLCDTCDSKIEKFEDVINLKLIDPKNFDNSIDKDVCRNCAGKLKYVSENLKNKNIAERIGNVLNDLVGNKK